MRESHWLGVCEASESEVVLLLAAVLLLFGVVRRLRKFVSVKCEGCCCGCCCCCARRSAVFSQLGGAVVSAMLCCGCCGCCWSVK